MKTKPSRIQLATVLLLFILTVPPLISSALSFDANSPLTHLTNASAAVRPSDITPWKPRPVLGGQKTLVLLVQFSDVRFKSSITEIKSLVDSVDKWFRKSSYGKMYIDYTIHGKAMTLPGKMSSYGAPKSGNQRGDDPQRSSNYIYDALTLADENGVELSNYKHVVLIHAGGDEAETSNPNEIWSYCDCSGPIADEDPENEATWFLRDDKTHKITHAFWGISTFSETGSWATFVHEYTHSIGTSDLYVYGADGYSTGPGVGFWSNMAAGAQLDPPADIDGWTKYILGWIQAVTVDSPKGEYTIHTLDSNAEPKALVIKIRGNENEYYFAHARRKVEFDSALPSEGVVVFRINTLRERSLEGEELALIADANPQTPGDCDEYNDMGRQLCRPLDAPYNTKGKEYHFTFYRMSEDLVLNYDGFWDESARIAFKAKPVADDAFKITFGQSPEDVGITVPPTTTTTTTSTTHTETTTGRCIIATAAFGSEMAPEVTYMRFVRDKLIASTNVGRVLVNAFNTFYYLWSPPVARAIATNEILRAIFRIMLTPLVWIIHATAALFTTTAHLSGSTDLASVVAFLLAALMCVTSYIALPAALVTRLAQKTGRSRFTQHV